jgi:hypothetical protein
VRVVRISGIFDRKNVFRTLTFAVVWTLIFTTLPFIYLGIKGWETFPNVNWFFDAILAIVGLISFFAALAIYVAMWIYLFVRDKKPMGSRILWGTIIFFTGWYGSCLYFLLVYRRQFSTAPGAEQRLAAPCLRTDI